jgi:hypothetical protein
MKPSGGTELLERPAPPEIDPRIAQRWIDARKEEGRRRLRLLAVAAVFATLVGLAVGSLYSPLFQLRHVEVSVRGAGPAPDAAAVARLAGIVGSPLVIHFDANAAAARLDAVPSLGAARVVVHWPRTVSISVSTRTPLAAVALPGGPAGTHGWALVDSTGRVLSDSATVPAGVALITETSEVPAPGAWLAGSPGPAADPAAPEGGVDMNAVSDAADMPEPTSAALAVLADLPPLLRSDVVSMDATTLTMVVVPPRLASGSMTVSFGDGSQLSAKVAALVAVIEHADLSGLAYLDLSVPARPAGAATPPKFAETPTTGFIAP